MRIGPVQGNLAIQGGVDLADFRLTRNGSPLSRTGVNLAGTASDYTLDLSVLTSDRSHYVLRLVAPSSGITDLAGNPLAGDATDEWRMNPWHNFTDALNADGQPGVFAIDALVVSTNSTTSCYPIPSQDRSRRRRQVRRSTTT